MLPVAIREVITVAHSPWAYTIGISSRIVVTNVKERPCYSSSIYGSAIIAVIAVLAGMVVQRLGAAVAMVAVATVAGQSIKGSVT